MSAVCSCMKKRHSFAVNTKHSSFVSVNISLTCERRHLVNTDNGSLDEFYFDTFFFFCKVRA